MPRARIYILSFIYLCTLCMFLGQGMQAARAQGGAPFSVRSAYLQLVDEVYVLDARLHLPVDPQLRAVLKDGVPLKLELHIEVSRARNYWIDAGVASLVQQYELQYHAVSERYVVRNLNSGEQTTFPDFEPALEHLTRIHNLPVLDRALIARKKADKARSYEARMRAIVNVGDTPAALRWVMFWANDWDRDSEWYTWSLQP